MESIPGTVYSFSNYSLCGLKKTLESMSLEDFAMMVDKLDELSLLSVALQSSEASLVSADYLI